jgi:hypothetical protein
MLMGGYKGEWNRCRGLKGLIRLEKDELARVPGLQGAPDYVRASWGAAGCAPTYFAFAYGELLRGRLGR